MSEVYDGDPGAHNERKMEELRAAFAEELKPQRVTLIRLFAGLSVYKREAFEEWAADFWRSSAENYEADRVALWTMERLGCGEDVLEFERKRQAKWSLQVAASQVLSRANRGTLELDYTDPAVLKYFALWLYATDEAGEGAIEVEVDPFVRGPIDWREFLADDLIRLPGFGWGEFQPALAPRNQKKLLSSAYLAARYWLRQDGLSFDALSAFAKRKKA